MLTDDEWQSFYVAAACANRPLAIPTGEDRFAVRRSPQQADLVRLVARLDETGVGYTTRQAAVWVVTDDASYSDLGILVNYASRVINEEEAARALQLLDEATVDITKKRLWRDRETIIAGLPGGELKSWLQNR